MSKGTKRYYATGRGKIKPKRKVELRDPSRAYSRSRARKNTAQLLDPDLWV